MQVNDLVKRSGHVIQRARDYWLGCGREPMKSGAKRALDKALADRGTVTALLPADPARGVSAGLEVRWDDGSISRCLPYLVVPAKD